MRKLVTIALILLTASLGVPVSVLAQAQPGTISGEALDAGGRALVGQRVDLVWAGEVVQTTTTGSRGEWTFSNVTPGDYIARLLVNGQVAGIKVSMTSGQGVANALIVAPSAAAPSAAFFKSLGVLGSTLFLVGVAAAVVTTVVVVTGS